MTSSLNRGWQEDADFYREELFLPGDPTEIRARMFSLAKYVRFSSVQRGEWEIQGWLNGFWSMSPRVRLSASLFSAEGGSIVVVLGYPLGSSGI